MRQIWLLLGALAAPLAAHADIKTDAIRIGVVTDMSGPFATAMGPGSVVAAQMAAEEFGGAIAGLAIQDLVRSNGKIFLASGPGAEELPGKACTPTSV